MKQSLYQILGVEPDASFEDIAIAYDKRLEEANRAADHNALVVLNQANEILSDSTRRAAYDVSLTTPVVQAVEYDDPEEPGFLEAWGKWILVGALLIGAGIWWSTRESSPPVPDRQAPAPVVAPAPEPDIDTEQAPAALVNQRAEPRVVQDAPAPSLPASEPSAVITSPIVGTWSCFDPVSGSNSNYSFGADGMVAIDAPDITSSTQNFEVSGSNLKLGDAEKSRNLTIEQMSAAKMILNTGAEGRRLVCTR